MARRRSRILATVSTIASRSACADAKAPRISSKSAITLLTVFFGQHLAGVDRNQHRRLPKNVCQLGGAHVVAPTHLQIILMLNCLLLIGDAGWKQRESCRRSRNL